MRQFRKNTQPMKYALQIAEIPEFDYYEDDEGNNYPMFLPNGKTEVVYSEPVNFQSSIASSGGEAEAVQYGMSVSDFAAKLTYPKGKFPLKLGALIWYTSEPTFKRIDLDVEIGDVAITLNGDYPEKTSADYYVVAIPPCKDEQVVLLQAINK